MTNAKAPERKGKVQLINAIHYYQKMSRSLGNKRHEIADGEDGTPDQIAAITELHGNNEDGEVRTFNLEGEEETLTVSKVFDNKNFGYWRITVERPLRLNFQVSEARIKRLDEETTFANLAKSKKKGQAARDEIAEGQKLQDDIKTMLRSMDAEKVYKNRDTFEAELKMASHTHGVTLSAPLKKAILSALSERDETADICTDSKGNPEPDTQLRDFENVPLKDDIAAYFEREVLPHVPDAWIDESKTVKGYEISFTKYFYQYKPLRPLDKIRAEIMTLEEETEGMLQEVLGA